MHSKRTHTYLLPEQKWNQVTVLNDISLNLTLLLKKELCKVHLRVFEIVVHRNVDDWTQ